MLRESSFKLFPVILLNMYFLSINFYAFSQPPYITQKAQLSLDLAEKVAFAAEAKAKELKEKVAIVVLDSSGNTKVSLLMDNQTETTLEWAKAKAFSALDFKQPIYKGEFKVWNIGGKTMILGTAGGFPLVYQDMVVGAIGVSGTRKDTDDVIAQAGVEVFNSLLKK